MTDWLESLPWWSIAAWSVGLFVTAFALLSAFTRALGRLERDQDQAIAITLEHPAGAGLSPGPHARANPTAPAPLPGPIVKDIAIRDCGTAAGGCMDVYDRRTGELTTEPCERHASARDWWLAL